jgi:hypothetical protein
MNQTYNNERIIPQQRQLDNENRRQKGTTANELFYNKCNWIMKTEGKKDNNERIISQQRQLDNENRRQTYNNERIIPQQRQLDNENRRQKGQQRTNYFTTKATG